MIFAAPDILSVNLPIAASLRELPVANEGDTPVYEVTSARTREGLEANDSYVVVSAQTMITERELEQASTEYPENIRQLYLQLPENTSERVKAEAQSITADWPSVYAKVRAVETYLRSIPYNDEIEAPPPDRDPVEYFLYDIREGYCDYYATSMVVMLRSLGIPARTVSGYAEGRYDEESRLFYVTERDAHTWVEVFFPGYGWIEFEPTAGETQLNRASGIDPLTDPLSPEEEQFAGQSAPIEQDPFMDEMMNQDPGALPPEDDTFGLDDAAELTTDNWWFWVVVMPILLVLGFWFIRRAQVHGPSGFDPELPPLFYERLQRWAERLGISGPTSNTPYEQAQHISQALPEGRAPISSITEQYVRYRFSRRNLPALVPSAPVAHTISESPNGTLTQDWQVLQPLLWKNWLRKLFGLRRGKQDDHFALQKGKATEGKATEGKATEE
jgi:transglutaminase-like putative cysteine protease